MNPLNNPQAVVLAGMASTYVTELLKSKFIPVKFEKYPRATAFVVCLVASAFVAFQQGVPFNQNWTQACAFILLTFWVATLTYKHVVS